ncbi:MAG: ABC transporter substrate-binding protein [Hyphomicrobiales bacterium]|nr:ABC transporter substrate-binding protein [Hyphomicrobiales bacterium]
MAFVRIAAALAMVFSASAAAAQYKIMVVTWRGCEDACQGFQDHLTKGGIDAEFILRDANKNKAALPGFRAEARADEVDLMLTWGTSVTRGMAGTLSEFDDPAFDHDIPTVFTIVADPVGAGIVESLDHSGRSNVTGTYNRVPEDVNIQTIRAYLPGFQHLGLLYNANERNSVLKRDEVAALTGPMDFELTALELPLGDDGEPRVEDIAPKVAELEAAGVDFIYLGSSSFLQENQDDVMAAAISNAVPVLSPYESSVRESGALIAVAARYYDVGILAGQQAEKILVDGIPAGDLPVLQMTNFAVVINMSVAKKIELYPPLDLLQVAEIVD